MKKHAFTLTLVFFYFLSSISCQIIINEIYADVAVGLAGDANRDGIRNARADEFIEFFNNAETPLDISGFTISVSDELKHEFKEGTILPAKTFMVVFGGGMPNDLFGGSLVEIASKGSLGLGNSSATILLKDQDLLLIDSVNYSSGNINASIVRTPDITGAFLPHNEVSDGFGQTYSPGTFTNSFPYNDGNTTLVHFALTKGAVLERTDSLDLFLNLINPKPAPVSVVVELIGGTGTADDLGNFTAQTILFPVNSISQRRLTIPITNDTTFEGNETFIFSITSIQNPDSNQVSINNIFELTIFDDDFNLGLLLNEFLADPPLGVLGDANEDGERDAKQDEFLEFINVSDSIIDLSGMGIYDSEALRHRLPDSTFIKPNQLLLIFGGGTIGSSFNGAITQTASTKDLSLGNSGDQIIIRDSTNNVIFFHEYGAEGGNDQSLTFCQNYGNEIGPTTLHADIDDGSLFSPGRLSNCVLNEVTTILEVILPEIMVYPNPFNTQFYIELPEELKLDKAFFMDMSGQTVFTFNRTGWIMVPNSLTDGFYFLKMKTDKGLIIKKCMLLK